MWCHAAMVLLLRRNDMNKYNVVIKAKFGSDFQKETFETILRSFACALAQKTLDHNKNNINVQLYENGEVKD